jgi:hypothetical protein
MGKLRIDMKDIKFSLFITLTFWSALISNGWWVLFTQNTKVNQTGFILIFLVTLGLSIAYAFMFLFKFLDDLEK